MTTILAAPCHTCRKPVLVDRVGSQIRVLERHGSTFREHGCRPEYLRKAKNRPGSKA
jgi:hypothetical protein